MSENIIIDCDPGIDDAIALMIAQADPRCNILGVTTVSGNQTLDKVTDNALKLAELFGIDEAPIVRGADAPLKRDAVHAQSHGETGLGGWELPEATRGESGASAAEFIVDTVAAHPADSVTIVAVGPLTNIALALRADPSLATRVKRIVIMGGGHNAGNMRPNAEFNFYADAEAADEVLRSGADIVLLGLDLTWQSAVLQPVRDEIASLTSPAAKAIGAWIEFYARVETTPGADGPSVHDACAIAYVLNPELVQTRSTCVLVETEGRWTYGASIVDDTNRFGIEDNVQIGTVLDRDGFWKLVLDSLRSYEP